MAVVEELVTKFVFTGSLKPLQNFQSGLKSSIVSMSKYGLAIAAVTAATAAWANSTLRGAESLIRLSEDTGLAIGKLQEMQLITAQNGVSTSLFESSILSLTDKIGEAATQGSEDFNRLGISVRDSAGNIKSADTILNELNGKFKTLSQSQQISFSRKLGIDNKVISAFNKTDEALKAITDRAKKFGLITNKQTKELNKYYASIETLKFGFSSVSRQMALNFAPILTKLSEKITEFLADFSSTFGPVIIEFVDGIALLLGGVNKLISATIGWKPVLIAFGAAMLIAFPVIAIVAGVALILAAVEDLMVAFSGGKSVIADFFKDTFNVDIVNGITGAIDFLAEALATVNLNFSELGEILSLPGLGQLGKVVDTIGNLFGGDSGNIQAVPISSSVGGNTSNAMTNHIKIEVKSNDPIAAGQAVSSALNTQIEQASSQFGKGGR